jgi:hypothetical protein
MNDIEIAQRMLRKQYVNEAKTFLRALVKQLKRDNVRVMPPIDKADEPRWIYVAIEIGKNQSEGAAISMARHLSLSHAVTFVRPPLDSAINSRAPGYAYGVGWQDRYEFKNVVVRAMLGRTLDRSEIVFDTMVLLAPEEHPK